MNYSLATFGSLAPHSWYSLVYIFFILQLCQLHFALKFRVRSTGGNFTGIGRKMSKKRAIAFLLYSASTHLQVEPRARLFFSPFIHSLPNCSDCLFTFLSPLLQALNLLLSASAELSFLFLANSYQEFHLELPINSAPIYPLYK